MKNRRPPSFNLAVLLAALCLTACSALQIDVDVYKGPLSNEEEMQARQFAALAVSARPMLAALRNDIEDTYRRDTRWRTRDIADKDALDRFLGSKETRLQSTLARFVNGALYLYDDIDESPEAKVRTAHAHVQAAVFLGGSQDVDYSLAQRIPVQSLPANLQPFARAYQGFLCPTDLQNFCRNPSLIPRRVKQLAEACQNLAQAVPPGKDAPSCPVPELANPGDKTGGTHRTNRSFEKLSDPQVVAGHALLLFKQRNPEFEERVVAIARAFADARQAMRGVLRGALEALPAAGSDLAATRTAAKVVAGAMQPEYLACFLLSDRQHGRGKFEPLREEMTRWFKERYPPVNTVSGFGYGEASRAIEAWAVRLPIETSGLLSWIDQLVEQVPDHQFGSCASVQKDASRNLQPASVRRWGLARGPADPGDLDGAVSSLDDDVDALPKQGNALGFERGRLPDGIDTLTKRFLESLARHNHRMDHPEIRRALADLEEALVFFAERVLFVVNNTTYRALQDDFPAQGKEVTVQPVGDALYVYSEKTTGIERMATRMAVLQTLGNTLILHANDLRRRRVHQQAQRDAGPAELRAAKAALAPGADVAFDAHLRHARLQLDLSKVQAGTSSAAAAQSAQAQAARQASADTELLRKSQELADTSTRLADYAAQLGVLEAAVRTLVPLAERVGRFPPPADGVLADQERGDSQAAIEAPTPVTTEATQMPADLLPGLTTWVNARAKTATGVRAKRLEATRGLLASPGALLDLTLAKPAPTAGAFRSLRDSLQTAALTYQREVVVLGTRKQALSTFVADIQKDLAAATSNAQAAAAAKVTSDAQADLAKATLAAIEGQREAVINEAVKAQVRDAAGVQRFLLAALDKAVKAPAAAADLPGLNAAIALAKQLTPPPASTALASVGVGERPVEPREVIDQVIAELRQLRVQALAAGDEGRARNLLSAINAAYETRSNATFLRPASEYLKSVYSSTTVQESYAGTDDNLLDNYLRFVQRNVEADEFTRRTRQAKEQVEKLYWQNINRVTLAGGGKTNYVLAKDDVGNWYVKAYTADPETVIKSAQSLALFGAGKRIDTNLLRKLDLQRRADDSTRSAADRAAAQTEADATGADVNIGLNRVRERFGVGYATTLNTLAGQLQGSIAGLPAALKTAAAGSADLKDMSAKQFASAIDSSHDAALASALTQLKGALDTPPLDVRRIGLLEDAVITGLTSLRRFYLAAGAALTADKTLGVADGGAKAVALVKTESKQRIDSHGKRLRAALDTFESGLHVVGDAKTAP